MRDLLWNLFLALSPTLLALVGWLSARLALLIKAKTRNEYLQGVLLRLNDAVWASVREVEQTMVTALKAGTVDGKLTETGRQNAKSAAIATVKEHLGPQGLADLCNVLGISGAVVDNFLGKRVEAAIAESKAPPVPFARP